MTRRLLVVLVLVAVLFQAISGGAVEAGGGGNKGKAKGKEKTEQHDNNGNHNGQDNNADADSGGGNDNNSAAEADSGGNDSSPSDSGDVAQSGADGGSSGGGNDSGPNGNGNTGSSKTRKGLDDQKMNQNIYQEGDTLSYHVTNRHPGENTIIVKEPGKNGEIVFQATVIVDEDGVLNVVLTDIPEDWAGVYQVQIWDEKGMKNDNINIKKKHIKNPEDLPEPEQPDEPEADEPTEADEPVAPEEAEEPVVPVPAADEDKPADDEGDCITVIYHASGAEVTVVEFFRPEHAREPWMHESEVLGESRVDTEGAVMAHFAQGVTFVVFEYDEATGGYEYRATGEVIGSYDEPIHVWSDGDAASVLFDALLWTPVGAN